MILSIGDVFKNLFLKVIFPLCLFGISFVLIYGLFYGLTEQEPSYDFCFVFASIPYGFRRINHIVVGGPIQGFDGGLSLLPWFLNCLGAFIFGLPIMLWRLLCIAFNLLKCTFYFSKFTIVGIYGLVTYLIARKAMKS